MLNLFQHPCATAAVTPSVDRIAWTLKQVQGDGRLKARIVRHTLHPRTDVGIRPLAAFLAVAAMAPDVGLAMLAGRRI